MSTIIRDQGPKYNLGFGVPISSIPARTDNEGNQQEGPNPRSGFIAKALHDHPIMRFFAVTAGSMAGMYAASRLLKGGGTKLLKTLETGSAPLLREETQSRLIHDFRRLQNVLNEWEGVPLAGAGRGQEAGWEASEAARERFYEATLSGATGIPEPDPWAWRDAIQQRLVHQARRLPYDLPAIYATQRVITDRLLLGEESAQDHPKWYNPVDVIGDFAERSVKNVAFAMTPWEVGQGTLKHGFRKLMTYGDFVADTSTFNPYIRGVSQGLKESLRLVGHDASSLIHNTIQKSNQVTGSFSSAISHYTTTTRDRKDQWRAARARAQKKIGTVETFDRVFPKFGAFRQEFTQKWQQQGDDFANMEALRRGKKTYQSFERNKEGIRVPIEKPTDPSRLLPGHSELEQIATAANLWGGRGGVGDDIVRSGRFYNMRENDEYKRLFREQLIERGVAEDAAEDFVSKATIQAIPNKFEKIDYPGAHRVSFGEDQMLAQRGKGFSPWHEQLQMRIEGVVGTHGRSIAENIDPAVKAADDVFLQGRKQMHARIQGEWREAFQEGIVPYTREHLGTSRMAYDRFRSGLTSENREILIRQTAKRVGIPIMDGERIIPVKELSGQLRQRGFNVDPGDVHDLRNYLVSKGDISKPWTAGGFNLLGLRPLDVRSALDRNYFSPDIRESVRRIVGRVANEDPILGSALSRPVGPGVFETQSGSIVDLSQLRKGFSKFTNLVQTHTQIPLLGFNPLDLFGYDARRAMRESPIIQFGPGSVEQRFGDIGKANFHMWMREGRKGGRLYAHGEEGLKPVPGLFKPWRTDPYSLLGRNARFGIGDKGQRPVNDPRGPIKKAFDVDLDQPQSLFRFFDRIIHRKGDLRNPAEYAKWLRAGNIPQALDEVEAFIPLENKLRRYGITRKVAHLFRGNEDIASIFHDIEGVPLSEINTPGRMIKSARRTMDRHIRDLEIEIEGAPDAATASALTGQLQKVRRAQGLINSRYIENEMNASFFEAQSAQAMRSTGIYTRMDEFRADMYRYLAAHQALTGTGNSASMIHGMLEHLETLKKAGSIGPTEYTEARAAVLSMHVNLLKLETYEASKQPAQHIRDVLGRLVGTKDEPGVSAGVLDDIAGYDVDVIHRGQPRRGLSRFWQRRAGRADYEYPGTEFNPFGHDTQFVPTFGTAFKRNKAAALRSASGYDTWSNPEGMSGVSVVQSHFFQRLNRYFSTLGVGVDESKYRGPLSFFGVGIVGKRVLPMVAAGTAAMAVDRTLGGWTTPRDEYGDRVYRPLITGGIATGIAGAQVGMAGLFPGGQTAEEKREELFGDQEVAIRKGRWWPLGNQPWKGGRVQYFRPSWYKRFMSGYQYGEQGWGSPMERLAFGHDFSPLRPLDPYRWEREHANDRPYPVTGEYFTGPWGPLTGALNLTAGRILKPSRRMHEQEMVAAMAAYQPTGMFGLTPPQEDTNYPPVAARNPTGSMGVFNVRPAGEILGMYPSGTGTPEAAVGGDWQGAYKQPYGFIAPAYGTDPNEAVAGYRRNQRRRGGSAIAGPAGASGYPYANAEGGVGRPGRTPPPSAQGLSIGAGRSVAGEVARQDIANNNAYYEQRALSPSPKHATYDPYHRMIMAKTKGFDPRVVPAANPIDPGSLKYQAGQLGYELQELFGIYGFAFGSGREALGFGSQDMSPHRAVLQSAGRGYGSERSFWDLNIGGFGDFPTSAEGEYGNMEFSEIARRFVPHRRRDITELNPLRNDIGKMYPWLPGSNYFLNFQQGDPYAQIPEGEMRLPGQGYERTHNLNSDATGKYGLVDQHAILGDIAPWSQEYRALDQVINKMKHQMSEEDYTKVKTTRKQVSTVNKRNEFSPYKYANADFQEQEVEIFGFKPGDADTLITSAGPIRLAGTRVRKTQQARLFAESLVQPGDMASIMFDANRPPARDMPIDAIVNVNGTNINKALLDNPEAGYESQTSAPIDSRMRESALEYFLHAQAEQLGHRNTILNTKFMPMRTAVEDWERNNVYGTTFAQWQHPIRDFLKPIGYKAMNRNPILSAAVLATAGGMFMSKPTGKAVGRLIGGLTGLGLGLMSGAKTLETGHRFIPKNRRKEMAVEEYADILNYVKYSRLYADTREAAIEEERTDPEQVARKIEEGDFKKFQFANLGANTSAALTYRQKAMQTMYGADVYGDVLNLSAAIPKRKRDHFLEFLKAPLNERPRILSTAPRLERRIYEARWGMTVERRPDLNEYFEDHELPEEDWEGWNPNVDMEDVKLKIAASQGLDVSQMGYYPQQVKEANLLNPSYPDYRRGTPGRASQQMGESIETRQRIEQYLRQQGLNAEVIAVPSANPGSRVQLNAGVNN